MGGKHSDDLEERVEAPLVQVRPASLKILHLTFAMPKEGAKDPKPCKSRPRHGVSVNAALTVTGIDANPVAVECRTGSTAEVTAR